LNEWYRDNNRENRSLAGVLTVSFFETQPVRAALGLIVDKGSADPGIAGSDPIPLPADHISICKFASRENNAYLKVRNEIRKILQPRGDLEKWTKVEISAMAPRHLECMSEPLLSKEGPLSPAARSELVEDRKKNKYELPDVDRFVFESDLLSRNVGPISFELPAKTKAKIVVYLVDQDGERSAVVRRSDTFYDGKPIRIDPAAVKGRMRVIVFVFPYGKEAYEHFAANGFKNIVKYGGVQ
jgi:hypothetical protein